jgi:hypothetical protein
MDFYHRTNYGQNQPVNKAILIFNEYGFVGLLFVMMKVSMFFVMVLIALCLKSGLIYCDCNNILDVPAEAISMAVCVSFCALFL